MFSGHCRRYILAMKCNVLILFLLLVTVAPFASATEPPITAVVFAPNGESVIAASQSGLRIYSWPNLQRRRTIECEAANLHCVAFSPDGKHLAAGGGNPSENGSVEVFSWPMCKRVSTLIEHTDSVQSVVWQSSTSLLSAGIDRKIEQSAVDHDPSQNGRSSGPNSPRSAAKGNRRTFDGHSRSVSAVCILNNRQTFVSAGADQSLRVWSIESGKLIRSLNQHTGAVHDLALCPADKALPMLASAAGDRTIRFWQPTIGRMVRYIRLDAEPLSIAWLNEDTLVAGCVDGRLRIIDANNVKVTGSHHATDGWAYAVAVHPHDGSVVTAGTGGQLHRIERSDLNRKRESPNSR